MEQEVSTVPTGLFGQTYPAPRRAGPGPLTRRLLQFLWEKDLLPKFVKWCQGLRPSRPSTSLRAVSLSNGAREGEGQEGNPSASLV